MVVKKMSPHKREPNLKKKYSSCEHMIKVNAFIFVLKNANF